MVPTCHFCMLFYGSPVSGRMSPRTLSWVFCAKLHQSLAISIPCPPFILAYISLFSQICFSNMSIKASCISMIIMKRSGLSADTWCNPTFISKYSVLPHLVFTLVLFPLYMSCITFTYRSGIDLFLMAEENIILSRC